MQRETQECTQLSRRRVDQLVELRDECQAIVRELQQRLQQSEERTLRGEVLVAKLRAAFVQMHGQGPQPP